MGRAGSRAGEEEKIKGHELSRAETITNDDKKGVIKKKQNGIGALVGRSSE